MAPIFCFKRTKTIIWQWVRLRVRFWSCDLTVECVFGKKFPPPKKKLCLRQCDYIRIFSKGNGDEFYCQSGLNIRWLLGDLKKVTIEASKTTFWAILEKVWLLCIQSFGHTACLQKRLTTDGTIYCEIGSRHSLSCCSLYMAASCMVSFSEHFINIF